jgi:hypothetical protein
MLGVIEADTDEPAHTGEWRPMTRPRRQARQAFESHLAQAPQSVASECRCGDVAHYTRELRTPPDASSTPGTSDPGSPTRINFMRPSNY